MTTAQFSMVVSAYAFSAGASGLLTAGFADKFDRKKILLFFYTGFIVGTLLCGLAPTYHFLLVARIVTGIFGGVISSISFAIVTDLFNLEVRGRVMGVVQTAFSASQVLGIPVSLYLAGHMGWNAPFLLIVGLSVIIGVLILVYMKPIDAHVTIQSDISPLKHFGHIISQSRYLKGFAATTLLATGGFMLMPFGSAYSVYNLGISLKQLPVVYMITGTFSIAAGPLLGKLADQMGKYTLFVMGSVVNIAMVVIYCNLGITPIWIVITLNTILFFGIIARMISSSALMTAIPEVKDRGAFMSINSSIQQIAGGIASVIAGLIVYQKTNTSALKNYDTLGYVVSATILVTIVFMYTINRYVTKKQSLAMHAAQTTDSLAKA